MQEPRGSPPNPLSALHVVVAILVHDDPHMARAKQHEPLQKLALARRAQMHHVARALLGGVFCDPRVATHVCGPVVDLFVELPYKAWLLGVSPGQNPVTDADGDAVVRVWVLDGRQSEDWWHIWEPSGW